MKALDFFNSVGCEVRLGGKNVGRETFNICCIFCMESGFHLGIHHTKFWFNCFVCGKRGKLKTLVYELNKYYTTKVFNGLYENVDFSSFYLPTKNSQIKKLQPYEYTKLKTEHKKFLINYPEYINDPFRTRYLPSNLINNLSIFSGTGYFKNYIYFCDSNVIIGRNTKPISNFRWYKKSVPYGFFFGYSYVKISEPNIIVLTEGIFDFLRVPLGFSLAFLGSSVNSSQLVNFIKTVKKKTKILIAFDRGCNVNSLYLNLTDLGYSVDIFDWERITYDVKDLDELYLYLDDEENFNDIVYKNTETPYVLTQGH